MSELPACDQRPIGLVGLRCSGKSTIGRELARLLGRPFFDLDQVLAQRWSQRIEGELSAGELLARFGEAPFRAREAAALEQLLETKDGRVIATGAGCVENARSRELLARRAWVVWLVVPLEEMARRMRADPTPRPALLETDAEQGAARPGLDAAVSELPLLAERRDPWYRALADRTLDCGQRPAAELALDLARMHSSRLESDTIGQPGPDEPRPELGPESDTSR